MARSKPNFRLPLWPTLITTAAVATCMALGFWQLHRLEWKEALLADIAAGLAAPARPLPADIADPRSWSYARVTLGGQFDHAREIRLYAPSLAGRAGYHVLTPLRRADGPAVLVDRGWVPPQAHLPAQRPEAQVTGPVHIAGIARLPAGPGPLTPEPDLAARLWYAVDLPAMADAVGYPLAPVLVEADAGPVPGDLPMGGQTRFDIPNNHLGYAVTWFLLALSVAVIYIVYVRRRR